jgi:hypothetical protein
MYVSPTEGQQEILRCDCGGSNLNFKTKAKGSQAPHVSLALLGSDRDLYYPLHGTPSMRKLFRLSHLHRHHVAAEFDSGGGHGLESWSSLRSAALSL